MDLARRWAPRLIACVALACSDDGASSSVPAPSTDAASSAGRHDSRGAHDASQAAPDARGAPSSTHDAADVARAEQDATAPADVDGAAVADDCDRDGDGVRRADPECPLADGLEPDCDDGDARTFPGAPATCRDTHFAGCSRERMLAESLGIAEARIATIDLGSSGPSLRLSATAVGSRLVGQAAGLVAHSDAADYLYITGVPETLVDAQPAERRSLPWVEMLDMQKAQIVVATLGRTGDHAALAVVDRQPSARLFSLGGIPTHELVRASTASGFLPVAGILDTAEEPTLITAATDATGVTHLHFASASADRAVRVDTPRAVEPWLAVGSDRVLWGAEGSSFVEIVEADAEVAIRRTLTASVTGSGALIAKRLESHHLAFVPTTAGLESFREPCAADDCQPVAHPAFAAALGLRPRVAAAEAARSSDLVALTIIDTVQRKAHLYFIRASDPGRVLLDRELHGTGDAEVKDVAIAVTERYGGVFLLVITHYWAGGMLATGIAVCDLL
jgi:hypothetical protein